MLSRTTTELADVRKEALFTKSEWDAVRTHLHELSETQGVRPKPATFIHDTVMRVVRGEPIGPDAATLDTALMQSRLKFLTRAPAGPWEPAIEHAGEFVLSEHVANFYHADSGDIVVGVEGVSLEGRHIREGDNLVMRYRTPQWRERKGDIVLIQSHDDEGDYESALKVWDGMSDGRPNLVDGDGTPCPLPEGHTHWDVIAIAIGLMAALR